MIIFQQNGLTVFQSALFQTNSAVVEGREFVLVTDPTWLPQEVEDIAGFVRKVRAGRALYLLFTHADFDHILGYGAFPDAVTIASSAFAANPDKASSVGKIRAWDSEYYIHRPYPLRYPDIDIAPAREGEERALGDTRLTFYGAPGHTPDGLLTVIEPHGILLAGDYLSDIEFPLISQSSTAYEETLGKLDAILGRHAVRVLVPGHGQITSDPDEMRARQHLALGYIQAMRAQIKAGDQAAIDALLEKYAFPQGMKAFHADNQKLMQVEVQAAREQRPV